MPCWRRPRGLGQAVHGVVVGQCRTVTPAAAAATTTPRASSSPSDTVEWAWSSITRDTLTTSKPQGFGSLCRSVVKADSDAPRGRADPFHRRPPGRLACAPGRIGDLARRPAAAGLAAVDRAPSPAGRRSPRPCTRATAAPDAVPISERLIRNQMMIVMKEEASTGPRSGIGGQRASRPSAARAHVVVGELADRDRGHRGPGARGQPESRRARPAWTTPCRSAARTSSPRPSSSHGERTVIDIDGRKVGGPHFATIAGPCTVESRDVMLGRRARRSRTRAPSSCAAAPTSRAPRPTPSRVSVRRVCACWPRPRR